MNIFLSDYLAHTNCKHSIASNHLKTGAGEPLIIFVLTFVYLKLPCDSTGEKLFVVLLTLYKSTEYISEILFHIETYILACLNERMVFQGLVHRR